MSMQSQSHKIERPIPTDVPDKREYNRVEDAEPDNAMVDSIRAAEKAGNEYLAQLLALELGSHYYDTR